MTLKNKPHHHGNLAPALVSAGKAILAEGGTLTLRQAAARAGVSHAAPAHHFGNLAGLRGAIATEAFGDFTAMMVHRRDTLPALATARDRLLAVCQGYLDFAAGHGGLFALMFNAGDIDRTDPALCRAAAGSYDVLAQACAPFAGGGDQSTRIETAIWSMVHGFAALRFDQIPEDDYPVPGGAPGFTAVLDVLLSGLEGPI